ncbi:GNAT family N-acetyltransferase [Bizionia myxarmorum]|uniref:GNAT family N-acetyltransferase n=1 Tax=Bizionia myxarmorum TaxID=291186 RepID=A0A5D0RCN6_9FLAO|nr:GNAT family N-acetyltransferase [Bizionia myxarmorum]TYB79272.1 GNAT family N-acetyltransferase [Bizionia myxarmorum]
MENNLAEINHSNYSIRLVPAEDTYPIRQAILRAGKPIEDCVFEGDTLKSTFHLGLFFKDSLIGVASFIQNNHDDFIEDFQYQLRGMAILQDFQKKGLGEILIIAGEEYLRKRDVFRLWFNAREKAVNFYKSHKYSIEGDAFDILGIGIHYLMSKEID